MSFITRRWRCYHPISDNISESPPRKENCHQIKINFIEWTSADTIIISSNCLKLTKSFEYLSGWFLWHFHMQPVICTIFCLTKSCHKIHLCVPWFQVVNFFVKFTFCAIIPSHQIVGTYQYSRTCMSTCISGESLQPKILRINCNHPSRWSVRVFISLMKDIHL